ncbi:MAG: bifunctional phosphopantothenoylcysteine decarboxylase/phosphopantothenate--cysteine ligase CoaBC [Thermodesulfovibrionales bacterium]|nr:bifunctional phosphopantothenoylcysteine decarboxylase/phosphopantothenate--cysteine ligase CoaBC [Thermodesulfovibrionales bacterium]
MAKSLRDSRILLGVTGSVAAYKAIELIKGLKEQGASVRVVMTDASKNFVTPLSLQLASGEKVYGDLFGEPMSHISLPKDADIMVIAPATASIAAKAANGMADDLLSACLLSFRGRVVIAPAMNWRMYESPAFQRNLKRLIEDGAALVPPDKGLLACGEEGVGRMAAIGKIIEAIKSAVSPKDLLGEKILVTAGPTREYIDPVRFISNASTGKMGYAIARAAKRRGAEVTLISGPSAIEPPAGVGFIPVVTAIQMRDAVLGHLPGATVIVMAAAVGDFAPEAMGKRKLDKAAVSSIKLKKTPDILSELGAMKKRPLLIGFAAEFGEGRRGDGLKRARRKLIEKGADIIVFNDVSRKDSGFGADTNKVVMLLKGRGNDLPLMSKDEVAEAVLEEIHALRAKRKRF